MAGMTRMNKVMLIYDLAYDFKIYSRSKKRKKERMYITFVNVHVFYLQAWGWLQTWNLELDDI